MALSYIKDVANVKVEKLELTNFSKLVSLENTNLLALMMIPFSSESNAGNLK